MRSSEIASSDAQVSSRRRCSGPASRAGLRGSIASTPRMRIGAFSGRYRIGEAGKVFGAVAGGLRVVEGPLRDARVDAGRQLGRRHGRRHPVVAGRPPSARRGLRTRTAGSARRSRRSARRSSAPDRSRDISYSARTRCSRSVATRAWNFRPAVIWPITSATTSITAKVSRYCTSLTANDEARRHVEEVERRHAEEGRQHRRPAAEAHRDDDHRQQEQHDDVGQLEHAVQRRRQQRRARRRSRRSRRRAARPEAAADSDSSPGVRPREQAAAGLRAPATRSGSRRGRCRAAPTASASVWRHGRGSASGVAARAPRATGCARART